MRALSTALPTGLTLPVRYLHSQGRLVLRGLCSCPGQAGSCPARCPVYPVVLGEPAPLVPLVLTPGQAAAVPDSQPRALALGIRTDQASAVTVGAKCQGQLCVLVSLALLCKKWSRLGLALIELSLLAASLPLWVSLLWCLFGSCPWLIPLLEVSVDPPNTSPEIPAAVLCFYVRRGAGPVGGGSRVHTGSKLRGSAFALEPVLAGPSGKVPTVQVSADGSRALHFIEQNRDINQTNKISRHKHCLIGPYDLAMAMPVFCGRGGELSSPSLDGGSCILEIYFFLN